MSTYIRESALLTFRSLRAIPRVPERILDVTIQPIVFILLFRYVFGAAIREPHISYADYLVPGIIGQGLAFGLIGTGTATSHDMAEGVLDRFRSMPVRRLSIVTGQVLGQYCEQLLGLSVYVLLGLVVGWHPHFSGVGTGLECLGLVLLAMFAFTWAGTYFGMLVRSPDAMQGVGFIIIFPLSFLAGTFVSISQMDLIPRTIGDWDPISALVATVRKLSEHYPSSGSWLLDHAELSMLLWSLLLLAIFVPLALRRFNRTLAA
ncbi:MAG TPA: ABC transporter permease [Solirubrobacteraceae bacterium]|jgi:ABC-type multidrug transport system permease subunit|nr:ABC transporter permease [Solirubrobacteraceae bacterium]